MPIYVFVLNDWETELLRRLLAGDYVSHASVSEHRLACEGADGRHPGKHPSLLLNALLSRYFSVDELALYVCIACDGRNCIWTRAGVSEVGAWAVENLCGGSARCGSCYYPRAITACRTI